tara:strand:- start:23594 stop:23716 length:123 start_codon:yes stop_codon:yes gene_type:complete
MAKDKLANQWQDKKLINDKALDDPEILAIVAHILGVDVDE